MGFVDDSLSVLANGGTELLKNHLKQYFKTNYPGVLDNFQIFTSRVEQPLDPDKIKILWVHDLPEDTATTGILANRGYTNFQMIIFVSNWQQQRFASRYGSEIFAHSIVLENAIQPIDVPEYKVFGKDKIKFIYTPTPHRGLEILVPVFEKLAEEFPNRLQLDVFSSFQLYGWPERDEPYQALFEKCKQHPDIVYHGSKPNEIVRQHLAEADVFAYPSIWQETSCLCLIEAISAKCFSITSNYAALPSTSGELAEHYQWHPDPSIHAGRLYLQMKHVISLIDSAYDPNKTEEEKHQIMFGINNLLNYNKIYIDRRYNWQSRETQWSLLLNSMVDALKNPK